MQPITSGICNYWWAVRLQALRSTNQTNPCRNSDTPLRSYPPSPISTQILRRLLQFGVPRLENPQVEPFFLGLLQRMASVLVALERHQAAAVAAATAAGGRGGGKAVFLGVGKVNGGVVEELQDLLERMAGAAVDAQKDHPIGFKRYDNEGR